jgi:hypothetical protein
MEAVDDILKSLSFVLQMNHVGLRKNRATAGHICRFLALETKVDKINQYLVDLVLGRVDLRGIYGGGKSLGLLIDKRTGAGSAGPIGVEIFQLPLFLVMADLEKGRVLTSHADDRSRVRLYGKRAENLADRLKFIKPSHPSADFLTMVPSKSNRPDVLFTESGVNPLHQLENLFLNLPEVPPVRGFEEDVFAFVYHNAVDAH